MTVMRWCYITVLHYISAPTFRTFLKFSWWKIYQKFWRNLKRFLKVVFKKFSFLLEITNQILWWNNVFHLVKKNLVSEYFTNKFRDSGNTGQYYFFVVWVAILERTLFWSLKYPQKYSTRIKGFSYPEQLLASAPSGSIVYRRVNNSYLNCSYARLHRQLLWKLFPQITPTFKLNVFNFTKWNFSKNSQIFFIFNFLKFSLFFHKYTKSTEYVLKSFPKFFKKFQTLPRRL